MPAAGTATGGAWVLLHGVTVPGRYHAGLRRMARALATAGQYVLVPDVPEWTALEARPDLADVALADAVAYLRTVSPVDRSRIGVLGFSVAGTWGLAAAAGSLAGAFRAAAAVGGYADLRTMLRGMVVGEHSWRGAIERYTPDPYGRWILGSNLLPHVTGNAWGSEADRDAAARALRRLAVTAGRHGAFADEPVYDPLIAQLRDGVPPSARAAWDLLAAPSHNLVPDRDAGIALADALADAGLRVCPSLDPARGLQSIACPVLLLHGRHDRLVPCSETPRLASLLPAAAHPDVTITRLLGHTRRSDAPAPRGPLAIAAEGRRFVQFVDHLLGALQP